MLSSSFVKLYATLILLVDWILFFLLNFHRFAVLVVVYFVGGVLFQKYARGAQGAELIPNYEFWSDFPGLIKVKYKFLKKNIVDLLAGIMLWKHPEVSQHPAERDECILESLSMVLYNSQFHTLSFDQF